MNSSKKVHHVSFGMVDQRDLVARCVGYRESIVSLTAYTTF